MISLSHWGMFAGAPRVAPPKGYKFSIEGEALVSELERIDGIAEILPLYQRLSFGWLG